MSRANRSTSTAACSRDKRRTVHGRSAEQRSGPALDNDRGERGRLAGQRSGRSLPCVRAGCVRAHVAADQAARVTGWQRPCRTRGADGETLMAGRSNREIGEQRDEGLMAVLHALRSARAGSAACSVKTRNGALQACRRRIHGSLTARTHRVYRSWSRSLFRPHGRAVLKKVARRSLGGGRRHCGADGPHTRRCPEGVLSQVFPAVV